jgi:hypothetical protein
VHRSVARGQGRMIQALAKDVTQQEELVAGLHSGLVIDLQAQGNSIAELIDRQATLEENLMATLEARLMARLEAGVLQRVEEQVRARMQLEHNRSFDSRGLTERVVGLASTVSQLGGAFKATSRGVKTRLSTLDGRVDDLEFQGPQPNLFGDETPGKNWRARQS